MIHLELKNKSCDLKNREDPLTSTVFGFLKYKVMQDILLDFIGYAINVKTKEKFNTNLLEGKQINFEFWKRFNEEDESSEIDLFLKSGNYKLGIEVKYHSKENYSMRKKKINERRRKIYTSQLNKYLNNDKCDSIIYITMDSSMPEIESKNEKIFWLSWHLLHKILTEYKEKKIPNFKKEIINDLLLYLENRNIYYFNGFNIYQTQIKWKKENIFFKKMFFNLKFNSIKRHSVPIFLKKVGRKYEK